jgi:putative transposase
MVDDVTRECLTAIPDTSMPGRRVARELTTLIERRGKPGMIVSDNGTELTSNAILAWSKDHKVEWHYIAPGRPMHTSGERISGCGEMEAIGRVSSHRP